MKFLKLIKQDPILFLNVAGDVKNMWLHNNLTLQYCGNSRTVLVVSFSVSLSMVKQNLM